MHWTSQTFVNNTFPASSADSFQFQYHFIVVMSNHNKQTPPLLPPEAHPPLHCPKPSSVPGVTLEKPINRSVVAAGLPYLQCYYPETFFRNSEQIINSVFQKQVKVKVLCHSHAYICIRQFWCMYWWLHQEDKFDGTHEEFNCTMNQIYFKKGELCHPFFLLLVQC